jgi:uncharacterized protein
MTTPTTAARAALTPVAQAERIQLLDILRGFAIFGILVVNIPGFATPVFLPGYVPLAPVASHDDLTARIVTLLFEGKFYTIFALLFGLGFSVQLSRAAAKGTDFRGLYARRLGVLLGIGLLHALLLWSGDILRLYALLGFVLLACRGWSNRALLAGAATLYAASIGLLVVIGGPQGDMSGDVFGMDLVAMARLAYGGSALDTLQFQAIMLPLSFLAIAVLQGLSVLGLFMLGLLLGRAGVFERLGEHRATLQRVLGVGLVAGLPLSGLLLSSDPLLASVGFAVGAPVLGAAYISALALAGLSEAGERALAPLAAVGRMALSNYVLQSVVCALIFNGYGLGWYEQVGAASLMAVALLVYLLQIPFSMWWLARFRFGPIEWLWRSLTYGQAQPFVRQQTLDAHSSQ